LLPDELDELGAGLCGLGSDIAENREAVDDCIPKCPHTAAKSSMERSHRYPQPGAPTIAPRHGGLNL